MKTIIQIAGFILLAALTLPGKAQTTVSICNDSSTVLTATNSAGLSGPSYSLNPGGITSLSPTFTVSPASSLIYTLYVTGTNSNSAVVTTTSTVNVQVNGTTYSLTSLNGFTLGCGSTSACPIMILNAQTTPIAGGAVSYSLFAPGSSTLISSTAVLSYISSYNITTPGTWSVVVRDNSNFCSTWTTVTVSSNTIVPVIGSVLVTHDTLTCATPTTIAQVTQNPGFSYNWLVNISPFTVPGNSISLSTNSTPSQTLLGTYTLVVKNNNNTCQSTTVVPVYQNIFAPNAVITAPPLGSCSQTLVLTNQSTTGIPPGTFPTYNPVIGQFWNGPFPQVTGTLSSTYIASVSGIYTMTAMDLNNGCTDTYTINLPATMFRPLAAFVHTITNGQATFNDVSTGTTSSTSYFWNFGDGTTSTLQNPAHNYLTDGGYLVKLKITNSSFSFCSDSVIQSVAISGASCSAISNFSMVPTSTAQVWNVMPSYPWNVTAASWSWGDGSTSNILYTSHQYSAAGMYNICLSVTVSCGDTSTSCTSYSVYRVAQEAMILEVNVVQPELISSVSSLTSDEELSWTIFPNPTTGEFNLNLSNTKAEPVRVLIHDLSGRKVFEQFMESFTGFISIDGGSLTPGMYFVSLQKNHYKVTKRIVVNR